MKVGQVVYVKHDRYELEGKEIEKIGRKYIYLKYDNGRKYDKDTLFQVTDRGIKGKIYLTREEYEEEVHKARMVQGLNRYSHWYKLSIGQLEEVYKIINK